MPEPQPDRAFDRHGDRGQVYATLSSLLKKGLVEIDGVEPGEGPERKRYAITAAGVTDVEQWLAQPEAPDLYLQNTLYTKVVLALLTRRSAATLLDVQRSEHLRLMRQLVGAGAQDLPVPLRNALRAVGDIPAVLRNVHAEGTVLAKAHELGAKPVALGIKGFNDKVICGPCQRTLMEAGADLLDSWTAIWPGNL